MLNNSNSVPQPKYSITFDSTNFITVVNFSFMYCEVINVDNQSSNPTKGSFNDEGSSAYQSSEHSGFYTLINPIDSRSFQSSKSIPSNRTT
jgi:hypothetical protein